MPATPPTDVREPAMNYSSDELRPLLQALQAVKGGDFSVRLPAKRNGVLGEISNAFNEVISVNENMTKEVVRVITAVADGDMTQKMVIKIKGTPVKGDFLRIGTTVNTMVDQLSSFASEVTRVAREVGTEGKLGGQAEVKGASGTWKDLTDNVNFMASNLTTQVRNIVLVTTAVANGDLTQKIAVDVKGEVLELKNTINTMVDQLGSFASEVTRVAREVGTEGKLGGQVEVKDVSGIWKDLTDNVNFMANSLTTQVRSISDVAIAVTKGDLTRTITVEAQGEILALKDKLNQMIGNLKDTTQQNKEQDWLKTNLARFSSIMQGQKNVESVSRLIMSELTPLVSAHHGVVYISDTRPGDPGLKMMASYAYRERKNVVNRVELGQSLVGQCALEKKSILLTEVPSDYIQINSGLGHASPMNIIVLPVLFEGEIMAVIELASFQPFSAIHTVFLDQLMESIGVVLNMITAKVRTEELLEQSQSLTQELQSQSQELQSQQQQLKGTNAELETQTKELEEKASLLVEQNEKVEMKNREVEHARTALEEKAGQLALSSKYKSEFLANMSHELRTPLNSMLILARLLSDNTDGNLTSRQTEFAKTIYASGGDLLNLINEILDLSKVEAGKMGIEVVDVPLLEIKEYVERTFDHVAQQKGLQLVVRVGAGLPSSLRTDEQRLQQVLRNLLSNAFKFTDAGKVELGINVADRDILNEYGAPAPAGKLIAFSVHDTGIGIPTNKHALIFEAFQQADGTTSRKYGGTGLGLSISREITKILGGRILVKSEPGIGSTFTLYMPMSIDDKWWPNDAVTSPAYVESKAPEAWERSRRVPSDRPRPLVDDRQSIEESDRITLIIEDDVNFAGILMGVAHEHGFKVLVAHDGGIGIELAKQYLPDAITLDLRLGDVDGWTVLDRLKRDPETRHIPVQVISVLDRDQSTVLGAISYMEKPVTSEALAGAFAHLYDFVNRKFRNLLVVEDDDVQRNAIVALIGNGEVKITAVASAEEALPLLFTSGFDCIILDLSLPGMSGVEMLKRLRQQPGLLNIPVIIYTSRELTPLEETQIKKYAASVLTKDPRSSDRLLDETAMFLHRSVSSPSNARQTAAPPIRPRKESKSVPVHKVVLSKPVATELLPGGGNGAQLRSSTGLRDLTSCNVLIVDDDIRNIFALTSMLESHGLQVSYAENGRDALNMLNDSTNISMVLMDIMMPDMDGYETTRAIRLLERYVDLPIIALTAKAMEGDREKCLAAGASDYIPKPVDTDRLFEMIMFWTDIASMPAESFPGGVMDSAGMSPEVQWPPEVEDSGSGTPAQSPQAERESEPVPSHSSVPVLNLDEEGISPVLLPA